MHNRILASCKNHSIIIRYEIICSVNDCVLKYHNDYVLPDNANKLSVLSSITTLISLSSTPVSIASAMSAKQIAQNKLACVLLR